MTVLPLFFRAGSFSAAVGRSALLAAIRLGLFLSLSSLTNPSSAPGPQLKGLSAFRCSLRSVSSTTASLIPIPLSLWASIGATLDFSWSASFAFFSQSLFTRLSSHMSTSTSTISTSFIGS